MALEWNELWAKINDAERTFKHADIMAENMARILVGRLRHVGDTYSSKRTLVKLKKELQDFNAKTMVWKDQP